MIEFYVYTCACIRPVEATRWGAYKFNKFKCGRLHDDCAKLVYSNRSDH